MTSTTASAPPRTVAALIARLTSIAVIAAMLLATPAEQPGTWLVDADRPLPVGSHVIDVLPLLDAVIVRSTAVPAGAIDLATSLSPQSTGSDAAVAAASLTSALDATGAPDVWDVTRGEGAVVALIDTGVAPIAALDGAVAGEIDFTATGGGDGYGHGTFLASLIAGRDPELPGVAPEALVLSLKVGAADGSSTLGAVLNALQWLHGPGRQLGVDIATLALAVDAGSDAAVILERGVERLARDGVLVVTAAGNDGPDNLTSPATSTGTFSVGAADAAGATAAFSGTGVDRGGVTQPDLLAPGVEVIGNLPAGSTLAGAATDLGGGRYRGTGTSMATALTAGVAALAESARPDLDGTDLDAALRSGGGLLDAGTTVAAALDADVRPGNGNGNGATNGNGNGRGNGNGNGTTNGPGNGNGNAAPASIRWTGIRWTGIRWTGSGWGDAGWGVAEWGSVRWTGGAWRYDGPAPQGVRWTGVRWTGVRWTGVRWTSVT